MLLFFCERFDGAGSVLLVCRARCGGLGSDRIGVDVLEVRLFEEDGAVVAELFVFMDGIMLLMLVEGEVVAVAAGAGGARG